MQRRLKSFLLAGLLALAVPSAWIWVHSQPRWTVARVRQVVARGTPAGSSREQVLAFLHSGPFRERDWIDVGDYDARERAIPAMLRHTADGALVYASIALDFRFNEDGKLARVEVKELFTGP